MSTRIPGGPFPEGAAPALWSEFVDQLVACGQRTPHPPPGLRARLEELRHRRDTLLLKHLALGRRRRTRAARHPGRGRTEGATGDDPGLERAREEFRAARRELRQAWRAVVRLLERQEADTPTPDQDAPADRATPRRGEPHG